MKRIYALMLAAACAICLAGCTREILVSDEAVANQETTPGETLTLTHEGCFVSNSGTPDTKTIVKNNKEVWWFDDDAINVYAADESYAYEYISKLEPGASAKTTTFELKYTWEDPFTYTGPLKSPGTKAATAKYYAIYPRYKISYTKMIAGYDGDYDSQKGEIQMQVVNRQYPMVNEVRHLPSFGVFNAGASGVTLKAVCGGLKFRLSRNDITKIIFTADSQHGICGHFILTGLEGTPRVKEVISGSNVITITPSEWNESWSSSVSARTFKAGEDYFIVMIPGTINGFTAKLSTTSGDYIEVASSKAQTVKAGVFGELAKPLDQYGTYVHPVPEAVDLGLPSGVKWASFNLGASSVEDRGVSYCWGETEPYFGYMKDDEEYKWCDSNGKLTKYNYVSAYGVQDFKSVLDLEDDAAHAALGGDWRMPNEDEFKELSSNCTKEYVTVNGVNCCKFISNINAASIIMASGTMCSNLAFGYPWYYNYHAPGSIERLARVNANVVRPVYGKYVPATSIQINHESLRLTKGDRKTMWITVLPDNATAKNWTAISSDESVATCSYDEYGVRVSGKSYGKATITVYPSSGIEGTPASFEVTVAKDPEYVDLGLSVKWAKWNVGANTPEEYGNYYAWGETTPKDVYSWGTYLWCNGTDHTLTKYNGRSEYGSVVDHISLLSDTDDVAKAEWKGLWRMPTYAEIQELRQNCTWTWTDDYNGTGIKGYEVTGNGNSIFLPAAGRKQDNALSNDGKYGYYWAGTGATRGTPYTAHDLFFRNGYEDNTVNKRFYGFSVRPVYGEFIPVDSIELNPYDLTIVIGDSCGLSVMYGPKGYSQATSADWISDNPSVATVSSEGVVKGVGIGSANITAYSYNGLSATCQVYVVEDSPE
ncbi:MAG: Ig-like domain-containing protein [Bacteroidales bacterium]|nr:Ig-like domain-containing protein [Bacteroidales bacterium]